MIETQTYYPRAMSRRLAIRFAGGMVNCRAGGSQFTRKPRFMSLLM
jgi:hypothetical protein